MEATIFDDFNEYRFHPLQYAVLLFSCFGRRKFLSDGIDFSQSVTVAEYDKSLKIMLSMFPGSNVIDMKVYKALIEIQKIHDRYRGDDGRRDNQNFMILGNYVDIAHRYLRNFFVTFNFSEDAINNIGSYIWTLWNSQIEPKAQYFGCTGVFTNNRNFNPLLIDAPPGIVVKEAHKCICSTRQLMIDGCKCGGI
jgi:hypothetical protein